MHWHAWRKGDVPVQDPPSQDDEIQMRSEEPITRTSEHWFWSVLARVWPQYTEVIVASLLINLFVLVSPLFIMNVYNRIIPNHTFETLWVLTGGVLIVFIFDFVLRNLRGYFIEASGQLIDVQLSNSTFRHVLDIELAKRPNSVGTLANCLHAFETLRDFLTSTTLTVLIDIPFIVLFLVVTWIVGGYLVVIPLATIPVIFLIGLLIQFPLLRLVNRFYQYSSEKHAILIESLAGVENLKGLRAEGTMHRKWDRIVKAFAKISVKLRQLTYLGGNLVIFFQQVAVIGVIVAGVYEIAEAKLTVGALIACSILTGRILVPIAQFGNVVMRYQQSRTALLGLDKLMQLPIESPRRNTFLHPKSIQGNFEFRNVVFNYGLAGVPVLDGTSFKISAGEHVGIIGRTGSGKSTIAKLLLKLYQPSSGNVLLDGIDERQLDPADIRSHIGYVPQDIMLFHGSIKDNLVMGASGASDHAILQAAKVSGLDLFTHKYPEGFDKAVGEAGQYLSGGQRQMVAIARAVILNPPILVFDEPTTAIDDSTLLLLIQRLKIYLEGRTLILITHKASFLSLVDRLMVVDSGKIIADSSKDEILNALMEGKIKVKA